MKPSKLNYAILALGIFVLMLSTLAGAAVSAEFHDTCGAYGTGKVTADLLDNLDPGGSNALTLEDINHLEDFSFKGIELAYASEGRTMAAYEENQAQAVVAGVSGGYDMFHRLELKAGSFIMPGNREEMVAVVDEDLALELFNNTNVVGMHIKLYGRSFRIIGVVSGDGSIAGALTDDGCGSVYIPVEHMLEQDTGSRITSLEIRAEDMGTTVTNIDKMKEGLASIGKNTAAYRILDYNIEKRLMDEKAQGVVFISGIGVIIMLLCSIRKRLMKIYTTWKDAHKEYYLRDILRHEGAKLGLMLAEVIALPVFILVIWNAVKFNFYVPAEYIPDELIDVGFYSELFKSLVEKNVQSRGYIPSVMEMRMDALRTIMTWNLIAGVFAGFPAYLLGLRLLVRNQENQMKHMLLGTVFIGFSIVFSLLLLNLLSLPLTVDTEKLLVMAAFILLSASGLGQNAGENK